MNRAPSPSLVISILALFVALGGTSYAAAKLHGKNIRTGTVTTKQVKNNSITGADIKNGSIRRADLNADAFAAGPKGDKGDPGVSVLDDTLASGKTMTGLWSVAVTNHQAFNQSFFQVIQFPVAAPTALTAATVNFKNNSAANDDADATCGGTAVNPTAPAGKVCIYPQSETYSNNPDTITGSVAASNTDGFLINLTLGANRVYTAHGVWAYTAP